MHNFLFQKTSFIPRLSLIFFILLTGVVVDTKAQLGRGCYVDGVLYTENTSKSNRHFYRDQGNLNSVCGFQRTGNTNNCRLYNGGDEDENSSYTLYSTQFSNDWEELACPLDDHVWLLFISIGGLSVLKFRVNNIFSTLVHATKRR